MRQRGYTVLLAGLGAAVAIGLMIFTYHEGRRAGAAAERAKWQAREIVQQQAYDAERERLRKEKDAQLAQLQGRLAEADVDFEKMREAHRHEKARNDRVSADIRAGRLVLRDPGAPAPSEARGGEGGNRAAPAGGGDGEAGGKPCRLSSGLTEFLWTEAARADQVITELEEQLHLAQDVVTAYYKLALGCVVGN